MLDAADVLVDGHPVGRGLRVEGLVLAPRRGVAVEVPRRAEEGVYRVRLAARGASADGASGLIPVGTQRERVAAVSRHLDVERELDGELVLGDGDYAAVVAVDHRYRRPPVALARNEPVAQAELHLALALSVLLEPVGGLLDGLGRRKPVEEAGVAGDAVGGHRGGHSSSVGRFAVRGTDDCDDRDVVFAREVEVALVVRGDAHDRARAVVGEDIVGYPDGNSLAGDWVYCREAGVHALLVRADRGALDRAAVRHALREVEHLLGLLAAEALCELLDVGVLRRHCDEGDAEDCVYARSEGFELQLRVRYLHFEVDALGAAYPVALHRDDALRPAGQLVEAVNELLRVVRDADEPLVEAALRDGRAASPADAVADDLLVREHRLALLAPVDGRVLAVDEPFLVELEEEPLVPAVISLAAGLDAAAPVVAVARVLELLRHVLYVAPRPVGRRGLVLYRRVLGRHSERVEAHRVEDVLPVHALEARHKVAYRVVAQVAHVERAARIGEHFEAVKFLLRRVGLNLEDFRVGPLFLPFRLDGGKIVRHLYLSFIRRIFSYIV